MIEAKPYFIRSAIFIISLFIFSCNEPVHKLSRKSSDGLLPQGEWLDTTDTLNGISIRKNLIAYFENMQFTSDDLNEYQIVDSIYQQSEETTLKGEYLIVINPKDSLTFKIVKRNKNVIILKDADGEEKIFKFWK